MAAAAAESESDNESEAAQHAPANKATAPDSGSDSEAFEQEEDSEDAMLERMMEAANMDTAVQSSDSEQVGCTVLTCALIGCPKLLCLPNYPI